MIEPGVVALATGDAATAALIVDRFYPLVLEEDCDKPAVTYRIVSTIDSFFLDDDAPITQIRLQLDSWGTTYGQAKAVSLALKALLEGYSGTLSTGVEISNIWRDGESSGFDQAEKLYYIQTDWMILFSE